MHNLQSSAYVTLNERQPSACQREVGREKGESLPNDWHAISNPLKGDSMCRLAPFRRLFATIALLFETLCRTPGIRGDGEVREVETLQETQSQPNMSTYPRDVCLLLIAHSL